MKNNNLPSCLVVDDSATVEEINLVREKLKQYNQEQTGGVYGQPGFEINLALKNAQDEVVGGVICCTMLNAMYLDVLWVADDYRKQGYGRKLVLAAEQIGREKGCISSHTWTFDFQAPRFYEKIGYRQIGVYDGYPDGLKEYVFKKTLHNLQVHQNEKTQLMRQFPGDLYITDNTTKDELEILHAGLRSYVDLFVGDEKKGVGIKLAIREPTGKVIGALNAWTTIYNMLLEYVWIDAGFRGFGFGKKLLLEAEAIAKKNDCIASLACPLSFQNPEFFQEAGYKVFGYSDGYPDQIREYYLIKRYIATGERMVDL